MSYTIKTICAGNSLLVTKNNFPSEFGQSSEAYMVLEIQKNDCKSETIDYAQKKF